MSRLLILTALLALAGGTLALGAAAAQEGVSVTLAPLGGSGVSGSATVEAGPGAEETTVNLELQGLEPNSEHVNHVHHGASCDDYSEIHFNLDNITADADGNASMTTTLPTALSHFADREHVIIVHAGASLEEDPTPISCGVVPAPAAAAAEEPAVTAPPAAGSGGFLNEGDGGVPILPLILFGLGGASLAAAAIGWRLSHSHR